MVDKVTLTPLASLQNEPTAISVIDNNSTAITTAVNNTLSRDGTSPNQMGASLDMNSNQIINLPYPGSSTSPVRLTDLTTGISTITAATGSSGHTVPFLDGLNTWGGTDTFLGPVRFGFDPFYDVKAYGAKGDGVTDDTTAFLAVASAASTFGGIIFVPPGTYKISQTIVLTTNTILQGAGRTASYIFTRTDVPIVNISGASQNGMRDLSIFGKGSFFNTPDTGTFGATANAVEMHSSGGHIYNCNISGGNVPLHIDSIDAVFFNVNVAQGYGNTNVLVDGIGQNWYIRCKFDTDNQAGLPQNNTRPYTNWTPTTAYTVGDLRVNAGYVMQCSVSGTSGGSAPGLKNFGVTMVDGTASWVLLVPSFYNGLILSGNSGENYFFQVDFSGPFSNSVIASSGAAGIGGFPNFFFTNCVFSSLLLLQQASMVNINNCEVGGALAVNLGYNGKFNYSNNIAIGPLPTVSVAAGVSGFIVSNNMFNAGSIAITAGASDHYIITNNIGVTVIDGGTGTHKTVSGNVT